MSLVRDKKTVSRIIKISQAIREIHEIFATKVKELSLLKIRNRWGFGGFYNQPAGCLSFQHRSLIPGRRRLLLSYRRGIYKGNL